MNCKNLKNAMLVKPKLSLPNMLVTDLKMKLNLTMTRAKKDWSIESHRLKKWSTVISFIFMVKINFHNSKIPVLIINIRWIT